MNIFTGDKKGKNFSISALHFSTYSTCQLLFLLARPVEVLKDGGTVTLQPQLVSVVVDNGFGVRYLMLTPYAYLMLHYILPSRCHFTDICQLEKQSNSTALTHLSKKKKKKTRRVTNYMELKLCCLRPADLFLPHLGFSSAGCKHNTGTLPLNKVGVAKQ